MPGVWPWRLRRFTRFCAIRPDIAEVHNDLAIILAASTTASSARRRRAVELKRSFSSRSLPDVYFNLGKVLNDLGRYDEAVARFEQAIALRPNHAEAYNNLGVVLRNQRKHGEAAARFEQAIAWRFDYAEAHHNLGNTLWKQDKFDEAAARFRQVLTLKPDYAEALNGRHHARALVESSSVRWHSLDRRSACDPSYAEALNRPGDLLFAPRRLRAWLARLSSAIAIAWGSMAT